jgi:deferrochelatase/peroxidase EfeB
VTVSNVPQLTVLLKTLTAEAEHLMSAAAQERHGAAAGPLTVTLGLGPGLLSERFGLTARRPVALHELPAFAGDELDPAVCDGDLCVQACAPRRQLAADALARLVDRTSDCARLRWSQDGFVHRARRRSPRRSSAQPARLPRRRQQPAPRQGLRAPRLGRAR